MFLIKFMSFYIASQPDKQSNLERFKGFIKFYENIFWVNSTFLVDINMLLGFITNEILARAYYYNEFQEWDTGWAPSWALKHFNC